MKQQKTESKHVSIHRRLLGKQIMDPAVSGMNTTQLYKNEVALYVLYAWLEQGV